MENVSKKLIIAAEIYPPDLGGPATYVEKLRLKLKKAGFQVRVITYGETDEQNNDIIKISRNHAIFLRVISYFINLLKLTKSCDIIYAQGSVNAGLLSLVAAKARRKKIIIKVVGDFAWERAQNYYGINDNIEEFQTKKYSIKIEALKKIERLVARNADQVIVPSKYLKRIVSTWGVDEDRINVIYNAVLISKTKLTRKQAKSLIKLEKDIILSIGRFVKWKGFDCLIDIMEDISKEHSNVHLVIIGSGPETNSLNKKIKEKKLNDRILLLAAMGREQMKRYIIASSVFVLNTRYEGLSHQILEVMSLGVPVVTTNIGGNPEIIQNNYNGVLVDPDDKKALAAAIKRLLTDYNFRESIIVNARKTMSKFSEKEMLDKTINALGL